MYVQQIPWKENYNEAQMPGYTLPEVLRCQDGTVITDAETWRRKRRPELLPLDQHELIALVQRQQEVGSAFVKVFESGWRHRQFFICHDAGLPFQRNGIHHLVVHHFGY